MPTVGLSSAPRLRSSYIRTYVHIHLADILVRQLTTPQIKNNKAFQDVIVEDQVDVKIFAFGADALLASDKGNPLPSSSRNAWSCVISASSRLLSSKDSAFLQAKELQQHGGAYEFTWICLESLQVRLCFLFDSWAIAAGQQSLVVQDSDLPLQLTRTSVLYSGVIHVPLSSRVVLYTQQSSVVGPAQFVRQCVRLWKRLIEQAHVPQVRFIKALTELSGQGLRQIRQQSLTVLRTRYTALFELNDMPPHFPASLYLYAINRANGSLTGLADQIAKFGEQDRNAAFCRQGRSRITHSEVWRLMSDEKYYLYCL
jgi:alkylated DNA nucleotide flippase Atl1